MTVSMCVMSAGGCYKYLLKSIAAGDGDRSLSASLTRYYAEAANPPGFWLGQGLASLGHGELAEGPQVSEAQLQLFIGMGHNPITGEALGRPYQQFASIAERIEQRVNALDRSGGRQGERERSPRSRPRKPSAAPAARWPATTSRSASPSPSPQSGRLQMRARNR